MSIFILLLQLETATLCDSLIIHDEFCFNEVLECALDEGDAKWCFENYIEGEE